jgi:sodium-dependent dicarboxylate transporter 2/3/5
MTTQIGITLIVLLVAMVLFIWNKFSIAAIAVAVPIVLHLAGILEAGEIFSGFTNTNVIMFVAMFVVGGALFETGMAYKIGGLVTSFAKTERQLMLAVMLVSGIMSAFLSNTGTAAVLMPIVLGISAKSGYKRSRLLMPLVFGATIGAMVTLLGSPGNLTASATLEEATGTGFGFFTLTGLGLPMLVIGAIFVYFIGYKFIPERESSEEVQFDPTQFDAVPQWKQWGSLIILAVAVLAMIFEKQIGISMYIVASMGALVLVFTGILPKGKAYSYISWNTIFLVAGMLPMATALSKTGAGEWIATNLIAVVGADASPVVLTAAIWLLTCLLTQFMSNSATVVMMCPIGIEIAKQLNADPTAVVIAILAAGSLAFCTPIAQPQNTMVYGPGGFKFSDYFKAGLPITILCFILSMILLPLLFPFY